MFRPTADLIADTQPTSSLVPWMWGGLIVLVLIGTVLTSLSIEDADQEALGALNVAAVSVPTTVGQSAMYSQDNANPDIPIDAATAAANDANGGMSDPFQALENWH